MRSSLGRRLPHQPRLERSRSVSANRRRLWQLLKQKVTGSTPHLPHSPGRCWPMLTSSTSTWATPPCWRAASNYKQRPEAVRWCETGGFETTEEEARPAVEGSLRHLDQSGDSRSAASSSERSDSDVVDLPSEGWRLWAARFPLLPDPEKDECHQSLA